MFGAHSLSSYALHFTSLLTGYTVSAIATLVCLISASGCCSFDYTSRLRVAPTSPLESNVVPEAQASPKPTFKVHEPFSSHYQTFELLRSIPVLKLKVRAGANVVSRNDNYCYSSQSVVQNVQHRGKTEIQEYPPTRYLIRSL